MRPVTRLLEGMRQRRHHRAFRIEPPAWTGPQLSQLETLLSEALAHARGDIEPETPTAAGQPEPSHPPAATDEAALVKAASELWRARRRFNRNGEPSTARDKQTGRLLDKCAEALDDAGLRIQDHEGAEFNPGWTVEVLAYQEEMALRVETVIQTVRPAVYLHRRLIQVEQVVVGTPGKDHEARSGHA